MADVTMPQLGETVTEGTITKWFKKVGEMVRADEPLFEVSTDKVDTEVPAPIAGVLTEIRVAEGDLVQVGGVIGVIGTADSAAVAAPPALAPAPDTTSVSSAAPAPSASTAAATSSAPPPATSTDNRLLSPVVRKLVNEHALDPSAITGTGAGGRITRDDVLNHIDAKGSSNATASTSTLEAPTASASPLAAPASVTSSPSASVGDSPTTAAPSVPGAPVGVAVAGQRDEVIALSKIRRLTGQHMIGSLATAPHAFSVVEVDYANVEVTRNRVKAEWKASEGFSLTYLPFISRAIVDAIAEFPHMNASVGNAELVVHKFVDLGIAVDLDFTGLLVPVVRDADTKRLRALAREINDLASRARKRKLTPDEISGGTFTISNNGSSGSVLTSAIISQPQVAIISTDAIKRRPVVIDVPGGGEAIAIHSVGNIAMSWDHRAFDGAYAARFLVKIKEILEHRDWSAEL